MTRFGPGWGQGGGKEACRNGVLGPADGLDVEGEGVKGRGFWPACLPQAGGGWGAPVRGIRTDNVLGPPVCTPASLRPD